MSVIGWIVDVATISGLVVGAIQLCRTRSAVKAAEKASIETRDKVSTSFLLPDVEALIHYLRSVKEDVVHGRYDAARLRLQDVKDGICQFMNEPSVDKWNYDITKRKIDLSLRALDNYNIENHSINMRSFMDDIEGVVDGLQLIKNQIKDRTI